MKWAEILENKTAEQCWKSLKSEFDYLIQKFIPNKKYRQLRKMHLSREAMQMIRKKQRLWKAYKCTGKVEDYTKYKDALKETTNEIRESKRNFERKLAANIKQDSKIFFAYIRSKQKGQRHGKPTKRQRWVSYSKRQRNGRRPKYLFQFSVYIGGQE